MANGSGKLPGFPILVLIAALVAGCATAIDPSEPAPATEATSPPTFAASPSAATTPHVEGVTPEAILPVGFPTGTLVEAEGAIWLFDWTGVTRVDPTTNEAVRYPLTLGDGTRRPSVVAAVGFGSLWVSDFERGEIRRYGMTGGTPVAIIETPAAAGLLVTGDGLWVANHHDGSVSRIDPALGKVVATIVVGRAGRSGPENFAALGDHIWVTIANEGVLAGIDPAAARSIGSIAVQEPAIPCGGIGSYDTRLFVSSCADSRALGVVDTTAMAPLESVRFEGHVTAPVAVDGGLWLGVERSTEGDLTALDPETLTTGQSLAIEGGAPYGLLAATGSLWVAIENEEAEQAWLLRLPLGAFR